MLLMKYFTPVYKWTFLMVFSIWSFHATGQENIHRLVLGHGPVYKDAASDVLKFFDHADAVERFVEVELGDGATGRHPVSAGDPLLLNLFPDMQLESSIERHYTNVDGSAVVRAAIKHPVQGHLLMSTTGGRSLATIMVGDSNIIYRITSHPKTGVHYLFQMNKDLMEKINDCPVQVPPPVTPAEKKEQARIRETIREKGPGIHDVAPVDVMVVYTPAARDWAHLNEGGIENSIALAMELARLSSDNSELGISFRLVHSRLVPYTEGDSAITDLRRLTARPDFNPFEEPDNGATIEGFMDEVHDWRNAYGADLVAFFPRRYDSGGMAWQLQDRSGRPRFGFSLTRVQQASWTYTHIHELGHNMGAHHHKEQSESPGPTEWNDWPGNNWSAGWRWTGADGGHYVSVMAYQSGDMYDDGIDHLRKPYFSNPEVLHQEVPTGDAVDGDNARSMREIKHVISNYRSIAIPTMKGLVEDENQQAIHGARVQVKEQGITLYTSHDGSFSIPYLPEGKHDLQISKADYYSIEHEIDPIPGQTLEQVFTLKPLADTTVSGFVAGEEEPEAGLDGAMVRFTWEDLVFLARTEEGAFQIEELPGGLPYEVLITFPGYSVYHAEITLDTEGGSLEPVVLSKAFRPVEKIRAEETDTYIEVSWDDPTFVGAFQHDGGGPPFAAIGFEYAPNSLFGGVHKRHAWINRVEWFSSAESEEKANLYILPLTPNGIPDRSRAPIYYEVGINNEPGQPMQYTLPETIYAPHGFFVGVGGNGTFYMATDKEDFTPGTNFFSSDFHQFGFLDMQATEFPYNFFVRARGYDFGPWLNDGQNKGVVKPPSEDCDGIRAIGSAARKVALPENNVAEVPQTADGQQAMKPEKPATRQQILSVKEEQPLEYAIYLDNFDEPVAEGITNNKYRFEGLPHGRYEVGVQAVYADVLSEITTRTVFSGTPKYMLVLKTEPEEAGITFQQGEYEKGSTIRLDALPHPGYIFHRWLDVNMNALADQPVHEFVMPAADVTLTAYFLEDPAGVKELKVYPNPAGDRINILADQAISEIRMVNLTGQMVYQVKELNQPFHQFSVAHMRGGLYILQLRTGEEWHTERVQVVGQRGRE